MIERLVLLEDCMPIGAELVERLRLEISKDDPTIVIVGSIEKEREAVHNRSLAVAILAGMALGGSQAFGAANRSIDGVPSVYLARDDYGDKIDRSKGKPSGAARAKREAKKRRNKRK